MTCIPLSQLGKVLSRVRTNFFVSFFFPWREQIAWIWNMSQKIPTGTECSRTPALRCVGSRRRGCVFAGRRLEEQCKKDCILTDDNLTHLSD